MPLGRIDRTPQGGMRPCDWSLPPPWACCWSMHSTFQKEASNSKPWLL